MEKRHIHYRVRTFAEFRKAERVNLAHSGYVSALGDLELCAIAAAPWNFELSLMAFDS